MILPIREFLQSVNCYLWKKGYKFSLLKDKEFSQLQEILKGNKPNKANALTDEEINEFYWVGVLGNNMPRALLNTVWMNNCTYFGMRPGQEQQDLCWGDLKLKTNADRFRCVAFSTEHQTKTCMGENAKDV